MIDPSLLKSVGFITTLVGLAGNVAVLFLPNCLARWEKAIRIGFIAIVFLGVISGKIGDYIIAVANGPRDMSPTDWSSFSDKMHPYADEIFTIVQNTDELEAYALAAHLKEALEKADWRFTESTIGDHLIGGQFLGVLVVINYNSSDAKTKDAAQALVNELRNKSIASRWSRSSDFQSNKIYIHIFTRLRVYD